MSPHKTCPFTFLYPKSYQGFTLAEMLIAIAILGVIAGFTIPKLLNIQNNNYNTCAKEVASMLTNAYQRKSLESTVTAATTPIDLLPYLNYAGVAPSGTLGPGSCASPYVCIKLQTGGVLSFDWAGFGGTGANNAIAVAFDPDGLPDTPARAGNAVVFFIYYSGRISSWSHLSAGTVNVAGWPGGPDPTKDPSWFSWN